MEPDEKWKLKPTINNHINQGLFGETADIDRVTYGLKDGINCLGVLWILYCLLDTL